MEEKLSVFDSIFSLIKDTNNEEKKPITLLEIKENLKDYSLSKLSSLISVLINSLNDLTRDKENMKEAFEKCEAEEIDLNIQVAKLTNEKKRLKVKLAKCKKLVKLNVQVVENLATCKTLECEKEILNKKVEEISKQDSKGKGEGIRT